MRELTGEEARRLRLRAQGLAPARPLAPVEVVDRGIAFQGQDLPAVLRAIALRSAPGTTVDEVRAAFDRGELVRGWTMRGTLFATTPRDLGALLALTAERVERSFVTRRAELGLTVEVVAEAEAIAREAIAGGGARRAELMARWGEAGIRTEEQRGYHLIALLSMRGLMHWGPFEGAEQLLVPSPVPELGDPGTGLARLAAGYLRSHGPATVEDIAWWLGLPKTPVRAAVAALGGEVDEILVAGVPHLVPAGELESLTDPDGVRLVPGFDEWVIGYRDRALVASSATLAVIVPGKNGVFRPAVLLDGRVVGSWRLAPRTREPVLELSERVSAPTRRAIDAAVSAWPHG